MPTCQNCGSYIYDQWEFNGLCSTCWNENVEICEGIEYALEKARKQFAKEGLTLEQAKKLCIEKDYTEENPMRFGELAIFIDDHDGNIWLCSEYQGYKGIFPWIEI